MFAEVLPPLRKFLKKNEDNKGRIIKTNPDPQDSKHLRGPLSIYDSDREKLL